MPVDYQGLWKLYNKTKGFFEHPKIDSSDPRFAVEMLDAANVLEETIVNHPEYKGELDEELGLEVVDV